MLAELNGGETVFFAVLTSLAVGSAPQENRKKQTPKITPARMVFLEDPKILCQLPLDRKNESPLLAFTGVGENWVRCAGGLAARGKPHRKQGCHRPCFTAGRKPFL